MPFDADVVEKNILKRDERFVQPDIKARYSLVGNGSGYGIPEKYAG